MDRRESARQRNKQVREEQKRISEERKMRSLRTEDFTSSDRVDRANAGRVRFSSVAPTVEEPLPEEKPRKRKKTRAVRTAGEGLSIRQWFRPIGERHESEFSLIACIVLLCLLGLVMITSSSYYYAYNNIGDPLFFLRKQVVNLLLGALVLLVCMFIPMNLFRKLSFLAYAGSIVLAVAVLFFGVSEKGSQRWLSIMGIQFQPAEVVKLGVALFMANQVEERKETIQSGKTFFILLLILAVPTGLVAYQNLTSGIIIGMIGITIMFIGGCRFRYFVILGILFLAFLGIFVVMPVYVPVSKFPRFLQGFLTKFMYRSNRVKAFIDPFRYAQNEGYQTVQSLYAIGSGGFFGQGLGESIQKLGFIPEAYNDIIFAIICDELGLVGAGLVILLFGVLIWNGGQIARRAPNDYTRLLASGLVMQVGLQAVLNIAVSTNSIPATGVSLPFISYGGSSVLFLMAGMGLLLNVSRFTQVEK